MPGVSLRRLWREAGEDDRILDNEDLWVAERNLRFGTALAIIAFLGVLLSYGTAGMGGLLISLSVVAVGVLLGAVLGVPASPARRRARRRLPSFDEPYPTYQQVSEQLSWAQVSPRHYDLVTRPLLVRLMASRLEDRHGVDPYRTPEAARAVVGEDVWFWLDPDRPAQASSQPPGVDVRTLTRLVERLENL
ncbi:MAG: hypothetical protein ACXV2G_07090 [Actinomycetes bacterium]